jgi:hydrogenase-1 operon protein HyaF
MSRLSDIPIRSESPAKVERPAADGGLGGGVAAILSELLTLLERLVAADSQGAIDLRSLPMSPLDRAELQHVLGEGEVHATVTAQGRSRVRETRVSGVWWVEHFDQHGEMVAELIDVSRVPAILTSAIDEIAASARALRAQLTASSRSEGKHAARQ